jgi:hypothetical protein
MVAVLENAGRAFLKVFAPALLVVAIGISTQPNLDRATAVGIAGLFAAIAAGLAALQTYVPALTFRYWVGDPAGRYVDAFAHGFLGALLTAIIGILNEPSLATWKALLVGAIVGAITAGLQAVEEVLSPAPVPPIVPAGGRADLRVTAARRTV